MRFGGLTFDDGNGMRIETMAYDIIYTVLDRAKCDPDKKEVTLTIGEGKVVCHSFEELKAELMHLYNLVQCYKRKILTLVNEKEEETPDAEEEVLELFEYYDPDDDTPFEELGWGIGYRYCEGEEDVIQGS